MPEAAIAHAPAPAESMDDLYESAVEEVTTEKPEGAPDPEPESESEKPQPKPDPEPEPSDDEKQRAEIEELAKDKEEPEPEKPVVKKAEELPPRARDLKVVYRALKEEHEKLKTSSEAKVLDLEKKLAEATAKTADDVPVLTKRLEEAEKRRDELESHMRYVDFTKSKEFAEKFQKPYQAAWNRAVREIQELTIEDESGNVRAATPEDLMRVAQLPLGEARKVAAQLFGAAADDVMAHRRVLRELSEAQDKALEDARTQAGEHAKQKELDSKLQSEKLAKRYQEENHKFITKYSKMFQPDPTDEPGNVLLKQGHAEVDKFFNDRTLAPEAKIDLYVRLRNKAANHDRLAHRLKRERARVKELETALGQYERSTPATGKTIGKVPVKSQDWQDEIAEDMKGLVVES